MVGKRADIAAINWIIRYDFARWAAHLSQLLAYKQKKSLGGLFLKIQLYQNGSITRQ
jgi:hypothetical protein